MYMPAEEQALLILIYCYGWVVGLQNLLKHYYGSSYMFFTILLNAKLWFIIYIILDMSYWKILIA